MGKPMLNFSVLSNAWRSSAAATTPTPWPTWLIEGVGVAMEEATMEALMEGAEAMAPIAVEDAATPLLDKTPVATDPTTPPTYPSANSASREATR